jgi:hypothetical protein
VFRRGCSPFVDERIRLAMGSSSGVRKLSIRRWSPASTTVKSARLSRCMLDRSLSSDITEGRISWASSCGD